LRRIVITVIVLVVAAGLTAAEALANSPHLKKCRERTCVIAGSAIGKSGSVSCRGVLARLALSASAADGSNEGNALPYDEFGLGANQPNQPRVGSDGPQAGRDEAGLAGPLSAPDDNNVSNTGNSTLPYDEFGLGANHPNQPRVGSVGP
jgi:hypothetical protein